MALPPLGALIFGDEFDGPAGAKPNTAKWVGKVGHGGSGVHWDGMTQLALDGQSHLVITAVKHLDGWHSGWLSGVPAGSKFTGRRYVEASAKVADGFGTWSSPIWEWPWPYGGGTLEVDVIERLGREPLGYEAHLHNWAAGNKSAGGFVNIGSDLGQAFHRYGCAIYPDQADFYFDGVKKKSVTAAAVGLTDLTKFVNCLNCSLNMGGWGGTPTIPGPVSLTVDYLRVYALA